MDRDIKIGLIVLAIAVITALILSPANELNNCMEKGAEAFGYDSWAEIDNQTKIAVFQQCTK